LLFLTTEQFKEEKAGIQWALDVFHKYTGFRFVNYTGNNTDYDLEHTNYLNFLYTNTYVQIIIIIIRNVSSL